MALPALTRLVLTDFRSYDRLRLTVDAAPAVLTGPNGAGKTNLLEAISMLSPGRGLRRARLGDLDHRPGQDRETVDGPARTWAVAATVATGDGPVEVGTAHMVDGGRERRVIRIDGETGSQAALAEHWSMLWLTPQMDRLFQEGASQRRRFFDRLVFGFDPAHAGRISAYEHAMRERMRLLRAGRADPAWLKPLEAQMAARGIAIAAARRDLVANLSSMLEDGNGPFPRVDLALSGAVEAALDDRPALDVEEMLANRLTEGRGRDGETGSTGFGPHRTDLRARHRAKNMPAEQCSTGEQKALLLSIVLAVARLDRAVSGRAPILLLDEVAAHLDAERRAALFDEIVTLGTQAWLTGTDRLLFETLGGRAQFFRVADSTVTRID